ncbi:hypothetical protein QBC35DRAFT_454003 [Podospora australis]|uniref:Ankyrin repeat protein n=1 Tax=Podospora australis TaxID=1536484 RepID=A0AAN6WPF6_9PEZI|nr:hypothetical protein QBC35DRAFT_454003 [Podospora australis]
MKPSQQLITPQDIQLIQRNIDAIPVTIGRELSTPSQDLVDVLFNSTWYICDRTNSPFIHVIVNLVDPLDGKTILHRAAEQRKADLIRELCPQIQSQLPYYTESSSPPQSGKKNQDAITVLLSWIDRPNHNGHTALYLAALTNSLDAFHALLHLGASIDVPNCASVRFLINSWSHLTDPGLLLGNTTRGHDKDDQVIIDVPMPVSQLRYAKKLQAELDHYESLSEAKGQRPACEMG